MITRVFKYIAYVLIIYLGIQMSAVTNPQVNWPIKVVGFFSLMYFSAKLLFPKETEL